MFINIPKLIFTNDDGYLEVYLKYNEYYSSENFKIIPNLSLKELQTYVNVLLSTEEKKTTPLSVSDVYLSSLDALYSLVAVLNEKGEIIFVNKKWKILADQNNSTIENYGIGSNYIEVSSKSTDEDGIGKMVANAIAEILTNIKDEFHIEYKCFYKNRNDWYILHLTSFDNDGKKNIVVTHEDITSRKKAEEKLLTSDKIFKHSLDMLCIAGFDGYFKVLNPAWTNTLGWSEEELLSNPWNDFVYKADKEKTNEIKSEIVEGKQVYRFENRYLCKDGTYKWLSWNSIPYPEENVMFGVARDVTQNKLIEEKINNNNNRLQRLLNIYQYQSKDVQQLLDHALEESIALTESKIGYLYFYNEETKQFTLNSWSKNVMQECNIQDKKRKYDLENTGIWGEAVRQRKIITINNFEEDNNFKKGYPEGHIQLRRFLTIPIFDEDKIIAVIGVANKNTDYADEDSVQLELLMNSIWRIVKRIEADDIVLKLSHAVEQNPTSIVITDKNGKIEYVNPKFTEIKGYTLNEVIGEYPNILKSNSSTEEFYKDIWETILAGKTWQGEFLNKKKNGELIWENSLISPILNSKNEIINYVLVKEDITQKKKMHDELVTAKNKAENADKLKSEFLAQMSHEIRTPLNSILSFTSLLEEETKDFIPEDLSSVFNGIQNSGNRLIRTISLIINASEIYTKTYEPNYTDIDIFENVLSKIIHEREKEINNKNLNLILDNKAESVKICVDEYGAFQIFENLIDNAIKFTKVGFIKVAVQEEDDKLIVSIKDSGIGISEDYLSEIYSFFSQEDSGYSRKYDGNGLGLAMVKSYCEMNRAEIEIESEKNIGSEFRILFRKSMCQAVVEKEN